MDKIELGRTGRMVSRICLGCMIMGTSVKKDESYSILDCFLDAGGNFIDTADNYAWWAGSGDESETVIGQWIKERKSREKIFLATKIGARPKDTAAIRDEKGEIKWDLFPKEFEGLSSGAVRKAVEGSLKRLQTDRIDLLYTHIDDRNVLLEETLETLNSLVKEGKIRHIGCSNYRAWRIEKARNISGSNGWAAFCAVQLRYSYLRPKPGSDFGIYPHTGDELLDYLRENPDIILTAYSPLLKGVYDNPEKRKTYDHWPFFEGPDTGARLNALDDLSLELGVKKSLLVLAWLLHHQPKVIPVVGVSSRAQLEENLKSLDIHLNEEQMNMLKNVSA